MKLLGRLSKNINQGVEFLIFLMGFSMALIVVIQVFFRYVLNYSLFWSEELARYLLIWLTFLGTSSAYFRHVHPGVDFIYSRMPQKLKYISAILVHIISICIFGIMIVFGSQFAWFVRLQISPALSLPKWIIAGIIPVSGFILILHGFVFLIDEFKRLKNDS
ncbi:TRAP transporter small membrane protein, DctQ-like [Desulfonema limicola]|uniref:TRAP transporter small membrane protein, DctQ-like n=1 Tax=Desulfonema limicola TaxID=45656 RepID=A0A975B6N5_9BACT|nr:TRAP transporter small permease [Desulfonema limicola]QTA79749.1 TRAP transporter small membrane protein, DctQ-like [Desulfonema limicola]